MGLIVSTIALALAGAATGVARPSTDGDVLLAEIFADVEAALERWEFRGEYWRDELDSYLFKIDSMCPPGAEEE